MKQKKRTARILIFALVLLAALPAGTAFAESQPASAPGEGSVTLWSANGPAPLSVCVPDAAGESGAAAAELLADYLSQATGETPKIVSGDGGGDGAAIVLSLSEGGMKRGGCVLKAGADELYIEANDPRGLFNGVYAFLREFCGVNVYAADVKTVARVDSIVLPAGYEKTYAPALEYADTDWISPHNADFAVANGLNGIYSPIPAEMGGAVKYITFCHSLTTAIVPADELLETHPEYFALQEDGTRTGDQLCLSNPEVAERAKEDVLRLIDEGYDETAPLNIVSVTQDDNQNYCICENCTALAGRYGGQSGLMLWFVNQIAEAVAASDHPDVVVDTFAYQYTRHAPTGVVPRENVCVRLCSIECCFAHALEDPACEENAAFMADLRDWAAISDRLYIWDYTTNYSETLGLFPDFGVLQQNIQTFVQNSVVGIYEEGAYYAGECNTEFADLRAYLLARFLQDPAEPDPLGVRNGFLSAYYGEGAAEIGAFLDYITAHAGDEEGHLSIGQDMGRSLHGVTAEDVKTLDALWDTAYEKAAAAGNTEAAARIDASRVSWEYYKACARVGAYRRGINVPGWIRANAALTEKLKTLGVTRYSESRTLAELKLSPVISPDDWSETGSAWYTVCTCMVLAAFLLTVLAAALCCKAHKAALLLPLLAAVLVPLCAVVRDLFSAWENVPLYLVLMLLAGLLAAVFAVFAAWALGGFRKLSRRKTALSFGIGALISVGIYNGIVFLVNNVMLGGGRPAYAVCVAFCWFAFLVGADAAVVAVCRLREKKKPQA